MCKPKCLPDQTSKNQVLGTFTSINMEEVQIEEGKEGVGDLAELFQLNETDLSDVQKEELERRQGVVC